MEIIKKIKAVYFKQIGDKLFVLESDSSPIYIYDCINFELMNKMGENYGGGLYHINNSIVDYAFQGINLNNLEKVSLFGNSEFYYNSMNKDYFIVNKLIEEFKANQYLISKSDFKIIKKIQYKGSIRLFTQMNDIVSSFESDILFYRDFSLLWQKNLSNITSYKDYDGSLKQGDIREIYSYNNTLIILTQVFILRLHIETGEIIYSLRLPAGLMTFSIEENKAYGCYGYHYMEIDLEKGELINFVRIENALLNGQEYNAIMNKASYKDGFVFHGLRLEGGQYAVGAINTKTGNREWISPLSINMVEKIEFHNDKMFISDTGGNLFIYQRE